MGSALRAAITEHSVVDICLGLISCSEDGLHSLTPNRPLNSA